MNDTQPQTIGSASADPRKPEHVWGVVKLLGGTFYQRYCVHRDDLGNVTDAYDIGPRHTREMLEAEHAFIGEMLAGE